MVIIKHLSSLAGRVGFLTLVLTIFISCEKPERNNPWDDGADITPDSWAPQNLEIESITITSKKLTWQYDGDDRIEGFELDKKVGDAPWHIGVKIFDKETREWLDDDIVPDTILTYHYRVYTIAGNNESAALEVSNNENFPAPENLMIEKITEVSYGLNWTIPFNGEQGVKIDRRVGQNDWELAFAQLEVGQISYTDTNVFMPKSTEVLVEYRVYGYHGDYHSKKNYGNTNVSLKSPSNLNFTVHSTNAVEISWGYEGSGIQGFRIDRQTDSRSWQNLFATISSIETSFWDRTVNFDENVYRYRVYAYFNEYESQKPEVFIGKPRVTTNQVTNISGTSASCGGNVTISGNDLVTDRGIVYSTSTNPTISDNIVSSGSGPGSFTANLSDLQYGTTYYVKAYASNSVGIAYGEQVTFSTEATLPTVTTSFITDITGNTASVGASVVKTGGAIVTERGIAFSVNQYPTIADAAVEAGSDIGTFITNLSGLETNTTYYVRAYATNIEGTAYGNQLEFVTLWFNDVVNPSTGKIWIDRNNGANRVASSIEDHHSYGYLYQWGRGNDGHASRSSVTTLSLSSIDSPGHGGFITVTESPYDWRSPQNDNLWQGVNGVNNPCPSGYRVPSEAEWIDEKLSWEFANSLGAFSSALKLPSAGFRYGGGSFNGNGTLGRYWSNTVDGIYSRALYFDTNEVGTINSNRAVGRSVRCIKE